MNDTPCGGDAFAPMLRSEYQGNYPDTGPLSLFPYTCANYGCSGCAHAVENGGKCMQADAEWVYAIDHARYEATLDELALDLSTMLAAERLATLARGGGE